MTEKRSGGGILIGVAAAAGALGAAAMMSAATAPAARADDTTLIIAAIDGDFTAGQADFTEALSDFEHGSFASGVVETVNGFNEYSVAAPDNLSLGTVEALTNQPITSSLFFDDLSPLGSFAEYSQEAQILFNMGDGLITNGLDALSAGDLGAGTYEVLDGSALAYVLPTEELVLGALGVFAQPG
jgi:hypothetical protein